MAKTDTGEAGVNEDLRTATADTAAVAKGETPFRRRLGEAAGSLGRSIKEIKGEDVTVIGLTFDNDHKVRALTDDPEAGVKRGELISRECVIVTVESSDPRGTRYFSFSGPLVDKLHNVDPTELPMDARFIEKDLPNGQTTWDVE